MELTMENMHQHYNKIIGVFMSDYNEYNNSNKPAQSGILPWIPLILAAIYTVSPVDLVPDVIPIVGWFEDALFLIVEFSFLLNEINFFINLNLILGIKFPSTTIF